MMLFAAAVATSFIAWDGTSVPSIALPPVEELAYTAYPKAHTFIFALVVCVMPTVSAPAAVGFGLATAVKPPGEISRPGVLLLIAINTGWAAGLVSGSTVMIKSFAPFGPRVPKSNDFDPDLVNSSL